MSASVAGFATVALHPRSSASHQNHLFRHDSEGVPVEAIWYGPLFVPVPAPELSRVSNGLLHTHSFGPYPEGEWTATTLRIQANKPPDETAADVVSSLVSRHNPLLLEHRQCPKMVARNWIDRQVEQLRLVNPCFTLDELQHSFQSETYVNRVLQGAH